MHSAKIPWNKDRRVGSRTPFKPDEIRAIQAHLAEAGNWRDLSLFMVGIDTFLRGCDLVALSVAAVTFANGDVRSQLTVTQRKSRKKPQSLWQRILTGNGEPQRTTGAPVRVALSAETRFVIAEWIRESGKSRSDHLFTRFKGRDGATPHITTDTFRKLVKSWAEVIGLDPADYSGHSLRSSRIEPLLQACGKDDRIGSIVLGHADRRSVEHYRAQQDVAMALRLAASINFFLPLSELKKRRRR